jgi:1,4-dihydroxy-2-naphthoate octaprenyltransferase
MDKEKRIHTLPVVIGERPSRYAVVIILILQYLAVLYLVIDGFFTPILLVVGLALRAFFRILPMFRQPKPVEKPADFPDVWPNYFVAAAFLHNREFGIWFMLGLIVDSILKTFVL